MINTGYPLYPEVGETESYLVECVLGHLIIDEDLSAKDRAVRLDEMLWTWREIAG